MLPKQQRISRKQFSHLIDQSVRPKYSNSELFTLKAVPSPTKKPQVAVSVSKKVSKKAVIRNRTRRRAYSVFTSFLPRIKPYLVLLIVKPGSELIQGENLKREIEKLLLKADLIVSEV